MSQLQETQKTLATKAKEQHSDLTSTQKIEKKLQTERSEQVEAFDLQRELQQPQVFV